MLENILFAVCGMFFVGGLSLAGVTENGWYALGTAPFMILSACGCFYK